MTLSDYYEAFGTPGLSTLAEASGTKLSYLRQLIYDTKKRPSLQMAENIIRGSDGKVTMKGLLKPSKYPRSD